MTVAVAITISNIWLQRYGPSKLWNEYLACHFANFSQFSTGFPLEPQYILMEIPQEAISGVLPVMSVGRPCPIFCVLYTLQPPGHCNPRICSYSSSSSFCRPQCLRSHYGPSEIRRALRTPVVLVLVHGCYHGISTLRIRS